MSEDMSLPKKPLTPAAQRALAEAKVRREQQDTSETAPADGENGGPRGKEPTRYGDWERKGIAYDF